MGEVRAQVTLFTEADLAVCLRAAYHSTFGQVPTPGCLTNAWSHVALECGRDGVGNVSRCRCYNLGNITASAKQLAADAPYWSIECQEQQRDKQGNLNGVWVKTKMRFLSFDALIVGALYYWGFMANRSRSLQAIRDGNPRALAYALAQDRYMTADPTRYANTLQGVFGSAVPVVAALPAFEATELVMEAPVVDDTLEAKFTSLDDETRREVIGNWIYTSVDNMVRDYLTDPHRRED